MPIDTDPIFFLTPSRNPSISGQSWLPVPSKGTHWTARSPGPTGSALKRPLNGLPSPAITSQLFQRRCRRCRCRRRRSSSSKKKNLKKVMKKRLQQATSSSDFTTPVCDCDWLTGRTEPPTSIKLDKVSKITVSYTHLTLPTTPYV